MPSEVIYLYVWDTDVDIFAYLSVVDFGENSKLERGLYSL